MLPLGSNVLFGEVIESIAPSDERNLNKVRYEYTIRATDPSGGARYYYNALMIEPFSGVDDFQERVLRSSFDDNGRGNRYDFDPSALAYRSGDRCLFVEIGADNRTVVILGLMPNPLSFPQDNKDKLESLPIIAEKRKPLLRGRFNGFNYKIDELGQARLQHSGAPTIKIEDGLFTEVIDEPASSITTLDFLSKGSWRLVDSNSQGLAINAVDKYISINNTMTFPIEKYEEIPDIVIDEPNDGEIPLGQEIRLDKANNVLSILSAGEYKRYVGTNQTIKVFGNFIEDVIGEYKQTLSKNFTQVIQKSYVSDIGKDFLFSVKNDIKFTTSRGDTFVFTSAGMTAKQASGAVVNLMSDGSVELKTKSGKYIFIDNGGNCTISVDSLELGSSASFKAVLAEKIVEKFNSHIHPTNTGSTGTVIEPITASGSESDPTNIASGNVKLKA